MSSNGETRIIMTNSYFRGHITMTESGLHCPHCSEKSVWVMQEDDDFYVGKDHLCISCESVFTIQTYESLAGGDLEIALKELKKEKKDNQ